MKKQVLFLFAVLLFSQAAFAYDFSAVAPSGQRLYYRISGSSVSVTYPGTSSRPWNDYIDPTGALVIPDSVTYSGTTYLVTTIGDSAFYCCTGLTSVTIGSSVTSIEQRAFSSCIGITPALTSVTLPNSVTSIGLEAFYGCSGLTAVHYTGTIGQWCEITFNYNSNPLEYAHHLYINNAEVTSVSIPNTITQIKPNIFHGCSGLTSVTIPNSVTSIGNSAFSGCSGLTSVTIPNSVTSIGGSAFYGCSGLTSVSIPNSVTSIGGSAFYGCSGLTSLTIGNSVTSIGDEAFYYCSGLTSITIPNSVTSIGNYAFCGCSGLTSLTIGNSVTSIGDEAFYYCSGLTSITIPNSVTSIGNYVFTYCSGLTSLTIGNSVTSIGNHAFSRCSGLTSVTIPNSVTSIGVEAFHGCSGLTSVIFNADRCTTSDNAFESSHITSFTFGNNVKVIPARLCYGMDSLTSITIPDSVTSIGNEAFYYCRRLTSLTIGKRVTSIGNSAFMLCYGLTSITFLRNTPPSLGNNVVFSSVNTNIPVYIPCGRRSSYTYYLPYFSNYIELPLEFSTVSADESMGSVQVLTAPSCANRNAVLNAVPANGYRFNHWSTGSTDNPYTLTVTNGTIITAYFEEIPPTYTVTVTADNPASGSATGGGVFEEGSTITLTATPADGYRFDHWSTGSTNNPYTLTVTSDTIITAYFEEITTPTYTVTVTADNPANGSVTGGGVFEEGTTITLTATPADGYRFDHWSTGSTDNPYTLTVTSDTTIIGYFVANGTQGIDEVGEDDIHISVIDGHIHVEGVAEEEVRVYDITGRMVQNRSLPSGVYMVKIGLSTAQKVVVMR